MTLAHAPRSRAPSISVLARLRGSRARAKRSSAVYEDERKRVAASYRPRTAGRSCGPSRLSRRRAFRTSQATVSRLGRDASEAAATFPPPAAGRRSVVGLALDRPWLASPGVDEKPGPSATGRSSRWRAKPGPSTPSAMRRDLAFAVLVAAASLTLAHPSSATARAQTLVPTYLPGQSTRSHPPGEDLRPRSHLDLRRREGDEGASAWRARA